MHRLFQFRPTAGCKMIPHQRRNFNVSDRPYHKSKIPSKKILRFDSLFSCFSRSWSRSLSCPNKTEENDAITISMQRRILLYFVLLDIDQVVLNLICKSYAGKIHHGNGRRQRNWFFPDEKIFGRSILHGFCHFHEM